MMVFSDEKKIMDTNLIHSEDHLEDHIDEPIKKCVVGMSLLGFKVRMSCCGFSYKGEKVPKTHLKPYLYLDYATLTTNLKEILIDIACYAKWEISFPYKGVIDFYAQTWDRNHPWNDTKCPHYYEMSVLAINRLEQQIAHRANWFLKEAIIDDGNNYYINDLKIKHWQYKPAQSWKVTPEIFFSL